MFFKKFFRHSDKKNKLLIRKRKLDGCLFNNYAVQQKNGVKYFGYLRK